MTDNNVKPSVQFLIIDEHQAGQRIDNFLLARLKGVPKSRIYRIIRKGEVRVNKKRIKPEYKIQANDAVRVPPVRIAPSKTLSQPSDQLQQVLKSSILYEDEDLLVINKPSGLPVHAGTGVKIGLIEALRYIFPTNPPLELAHRIDKGTSGCVLIAKHPKALRVLNKGFKEGLINKTYHALVCKRWPESITSVDVPLHKNQPRSGERFVEVSEQGKSALTKFRVLKHFKQFSLVEAKPATGRTHQIRVHAQYVGHPISGDDKYSKPELNNILKVQGYSRLCLHAAELGLKHPISGTELSITAPYDKQFQQITQLLSSEV